MKRLCAVGLCMMVAVFAKVPVDKKLINKEVVDNAPLVIGHRGASGHEPENTLRSFKRAIDMGVPMIELDVRVCKTGELVVIHDATIDRTTNGTGSIKALTWDTIKKYDAGSGERVPLLSEVFDLVDGRVIINVELKDERAAEPVAQLINEYMRNKKWSPDVFIVSSFNRRAVRTFKRHCPMVNTGLIFERNSTVRLDRVKRVQAHYAIIHHQSITEAFINNAHTCGIKVFVYTVNDKAVGKKLQLMHIDGIISDYPDILLPFDTSILSDRHSG
ncbi:MAG: glycerophosphodiester phosphodiesterase family protein [Candidatus Babeliaceae bacterium]